MSEIIHVAAWLCTFSLLIAVSTLISPYPCEIFGIFSLFNFSHTDGYVIVSSCGFFCVCVCFIYLFMAVLDLRFCARAFSSRGKWGPLFLTVHGPLTIAASLVAEHRLQTRRLSNCGSRAHLLRGMWDLPKPGLEPVSPALAGRVSTTVPPGKPSSCGFIFISLMTNDVKEHFIFFVQILMSSFGIYVFRYFAHFWTGCLPFSY